jgi:hypothetical protein
MSRQVMVEMALLRRRWPWRDVAVESYWRWRCQGDIGCGVMSLPSLPGNGAVEAMLLVALLMTMLT